MILEELPLRGAAQLAEEKWSFEDAMSGLTNKPADAGEPLLCLLTRTEGRG